MTETELNAIAILDLFEDFLEEKGVELTNYDKEQALKDGQDADTLCILYGEDYGYLKDAICRILQN